MTTATMTLQKTPLGVGEILQDCFAILFQNFWRLLLVGFVTAYLSVLGDIALQETRAEMALNRPPSSSWNANVRISFEMISVALDFCISSLAAAVLVLFVYGVKQEQRTTVGKCLRKTLPYAHLLIILSTVTAILCLLGAIALIIGAFWVLAVFMVVVPVIVIENGRFGSLSRSADLTKGYRWPIAGGYFVILLLSIVIGLPAEFLSGSYLAAPGLTRQLGQGAVYALANGPAYVITSLFSALVYIRLRETKEGLGMHKIADVFA